MPLVVMLALLATPAVFTGFAAGSDNAFDALGCTLRPTRPDNKDGLISARGMAECTAADPNRIVRIRLWQKDGNDVWQLIESSETIWPEIADGNFDDQISTVGLDCKNLSAGNTRRYKSQVGISVDGEQFTEGFGNVEDLGRNCLASIDQNNELSVAIDNTTITDCPDPDADCPPTTEQVSPMSNGWQSWVPAPPLNCRAYIAQITIPGTAHGSTQRRILSGGTVDCTNAGTWPRRMAYFSIGVKNTGSSSGLRLFGTIAVNIAQPVYKERNTACRIMSSYADPPVIIATVIRMQAPNIYATPWVGDGVRSYVLPDAQRCRGSTPGQS